MIGGIYSLPMKFELRSQASESSPETVYTVNYEGTPGLEFGCKYRYFFKRHNIGIIAGWKSTVQSFNYNSYNINGVESDIDNVPYFFKNMKSYNISGFEILFGLTYQF